MIESNCRYCGKPVEAAPGVRHKVYCSEFCRKCAQREAARERARRSARSTNANKPEENLESCMDAADSLGLTYGQYMAMRCSNG